MKYNELTVIEQETQEVCVAKKIVYYCLQVLKQRFGFFLVALQVFEPVAVKEYIKPATDGKHLFFHAEEVLCNYNTYGIKPIMKAIIHMLLHGVFGDFEVYEEKQFLGLRWAVMDLRIQQTMWLLGIEKWFVGIEYVPALYWKARKNKKLEKKIKSVKKYVCVDKHKYWAKECLDNTEIKEEVSDLWKQVRGVMALEREDNGEITIKDLLNGIQREGYELMPEAKRWIEQVLEGREKDYKEVLRQLLQLKETVKEEDTIDPALYLYGLECYGTVPLIEPLEESEQKKMDILVLAVDTSGSCIDVVPKFLRETVGILKDASDMDSDGIVYYMECDDKITEEKWFDNFSMASKELEKKQVQGGGWTNFCPVFDKIEELRSSGKKITALIYLSDGEGVFPETIPDYPVYFVMEHRNSMTSYYIDIDIDIPNWVTVLWI